MGLLLALLQPVLARAVELRGTPWAHAGDRHGIAPMLLYAVTLVESRRRISPERVGPWPWTINTPAGAQWFDSREAAEHALGAFLQRWPAKRIDVGAAQVNIGWHAHRVDDPRRLLDLGYNLEIAAQILAEAIDSTVDPVLGVGRYHAWVDEARARAYGREVWRKYSHVLDGDHGPAGRYVVGPDESAGLSAEQMFEQR